MNAPVKEPSSIDPAEREKFDQLAEMWWDPDGPMWPLHTLNRLRSGFILNKLCQRLDRDPGSESPLAGLRLLDIGCGGGLLSEAMAGYGASVHGVDISERNIAIAIGHAAGSQNPPEYELGTAEVLQARGQRFDVVLNMEVVEHVADLPLFMHACNGLVASGGLQVVATINRNPLAWFVAIFGAEYVLRWLPRGTHEYGKLVKPSELEALLLADGLAVTSRHGVSVNPLTRRMSLGNSMKVNYMLFSEKQA